MKEIIDGATKRAIDFNADGATERFYEFLKERRFASTRCTECGHVPFPPRPFCPACGHDDVAWTDLPTGGTLYAFSQQARSLRFMAPDVIGLVRLADVGLVLTRIDAKLEDLSIDQPMEVDFYEIDPDLVVHQFRPS